MRIGSHRIRYWTLVISVLLFCDIARSIPVAIRDQSILQHRVETYGRMLTSEPDQNKLVYYAYETDRGTYGGAYEPKESSIPYLKIGEAITVTYSEREPWKHTLGHELKASFRLFMILNLAEFLLAAGFLVASFPRT